MKAKRWLALILVLCTVVGLLPQVGIFSAWADKPRTKDVASDTTAALSRLNTQYNSFTIPTNERKIIDASSIKNLQGTYFMIVGRSENYEIINPTKGTGTQKDRLTADSFGKDSHGAVDYRYLYSLPVVVSGVKLSTIGGKAITTLDYAVDIVSNTASITRNTSYSEKLDGTTYKGWAGYIKWEYNRKETWSGDEKYGPYLGIESIPSTSDPVYNIKFLYSGKSSTPYLSCDDGDGELKYSSKAFPIFFKLNDSSTASTKLYKLNPTGGSEHTYWFGVDQKNDTISAHTMSQIVREDRNLSVAKSDPLRQANYRIVWKFYRISPSTLELYKTLLKAKSYVTGANSDQKIPADTYLEFLQFLENAMAVYKSNYNTFDDNPNSATKITCDNYAKDLTAYMNLLEIEKKPTSYMDIPLEVLDFRADGIIFENWNSGTAYALAESSPTSVDGVPFPGTILPSDNPSYYNYTYGLIEPELVNGQIVYRKETIDYVAKALSMQHHTFTDPAATGTSFRGDYGKEDFDTYWNAAFMTLVDPLGMTATNNRPESNVTANAYPLGSYNNTINKLSTKDNGGILRFEQISTCYDLAYYLLTNIWRQTASDDIVETVTKGSTTYALPYNVKINELSTLRLLKDEAGYYQFSSDKANGRAVNSGVIFNYNLTTSSGSTVPTLNAAAELGFESPSMFGNNSTGLKENTASNIYPVRNYGVMYHLKSSFVYYEEKNLNFEFSGDDDVYFFINGKMVADIGGMHSPANRKVFLNSSDASHLHLEDGDICTFDMFLVERHSEGINLNFRTNIEMMPAGAVTDKVQYEYTTSGTIGKDIKEGSVVADKTEVGYGFKLLNRNEYGAQHLVFQDPELGVTLSQSEITLNATANVGDLIFVYRSYDPQTNEIYSGTPQSYNYAVTEGIIRNAINDTSTIIPLGTDSAYRVTGLAADQAKALLKLGLPANIQLSIYGFHRTVSASVGGYTNTVYTSLTPIASKISTDSFTYEDAIAGYGIRNLNVQSMNTITAEPLDIVIDYGKPVVFTMGELLSTATYDPEAISLSYAGIIFGGEHGKFLFKLPGTVYLKEEGTTATGTYGEFDYSFDSIRFSPKGSVTGIETIFALLLVKDPVMENPCYLTVEIRIIPATIMYYEGEALANADELTLSEKYVEEIEEEVPPESLPDSDPEEDPDEEEDVDDPENAPVEDDGIRYNTHFSTVTDTQDRETNLSTYDPTSDEGVLFFAFDKNDTDRYKNNPVYGGVDFDDMGNWWGNQYNKVEAIENGALRFSTNYPNSFFGYVATAKPDSTQPSNGDLASFPLEYLPGEDDWCEIRLRIDKTGVQTRTDTQVRLEFLPTEKN
ncbi:MAG: fibro-slime domain-containing protein, partial [Oscillospiraceae bacterium]|nr:fibro-slime domain-containing protein [Oscillospiraceae bacterium]